MLNKFSAAWNELYKGHPSEYLTGSVTIIEEEEGAKNKTLTVERLCFATDKTYLWCYRDKEAR